MTILFYLLSLISGFALTLQFGINGALRSKIINREVYRQVPPKVEYSLTKIGISFIPIMTPIMEWGVGYIKETSSCNLDICIANKFPCSQCHEMLKPDEIKLDT